MHIYIEDGNKVFPSEKKSTLRCWLLCKLSFQLIMYLPVIQYQYSTNTLGYRVETFLSVKLQHLFYSACVLSLLKDFKYLTFVNIVKYQYQNNRIMLYLYSWLEIKLLQKIPSSS